MIKLRSIFKKPSVRRFRLRAVLIIAAFWSAIDVVVVLVFDTLKQNDRFTILLLRETIVFLSSVLMSYFLVVDLRRRLRNYNFLFSLFIKSLVLIAAAFIINLILYTLNSFSIFGTHLNEAFHHFHSDYADTRSIFQKIIYWLVLFLVTQLLFELNEKYSPGVFLDILMGKYVNPKIERRIVMFIDLKDSTPIAEKLGSQKYFLFIREFIYNISNALIEFDGRIYQYVGDEIVVSWSDNLQNRRKCILSLFKAHRMLQREQKNFMRRYKVAPEFRAGIHVGEVTVGEIGVIKKDLAMSGDTMNTAARIRSATAELNNDILLSKDFIEDMGLRDWQVQSIGMVELKGKANEIELFALAM